MVTRQGLGLGNRVSEAGHALTTAATGVAGLHPQGQGQGTVATPQGPITWTRSSDGTIHAEGGGQTLTVSGQTKSDSSFQSQAEYARTGSAPYLTMNSSGEAAQHQVQSTLSAASNHLTLTITNINVLMTSGTATLSGTWNGAAVHWTGHADLTSNPFLTHPIAGWPSGAFTSEVKQAAFFSPLAKVVAQALIAPAEGTSGIGAPRPVQRGVVGTLGHAGAWCVGGGVAASAGGPEAAVLGCLGGATGAVLSDMMDWLGGDDTPTQPYGPDLSTPGPGPSTFATGVNSIIQRAGDSVYDLQNSSGNSSHPETDDGVDTTDKEN